MNRTDDLRHDLALVWHQVRTEQRAFWRNRARAGFTVGFPLLFLVVFNAINGSHRIERLGGVAYATWFVPGITAYGVIMATFANVAIATTVSRDQGLLKRIQGTPLPGWVFLAGRACSAVLTAAIIVAATLGLGRLAYGVPIRAAMLPALGVTLLLGAVCCTVLGLAVTAVIPNADAAPAMVNAIVLPLTFISGIWMATADDAWTTAVARLFPVRALAHALQHAFLPATTGAGFVPADLVTLAAWTALGALAFRRWFRWT